MAPRKNKASPTPEAFYSDRSLYPTDLDDISPLAFETESELESVLARLRRGLQESIRVKWLAEGGDLSGIDAVEQLVLQVC